MTQISQVIKKALKNKALHYIFSRYSTYFIQFVNSLLIAVYLGPYYLGIWGFILLVIQYLGQVNFGIAHSLNVIIAINKNKVGYVKKVIGASLIMLAVLSLIIVLFFIANELFGLNIGSKYDFSTYAPVVVLIGILSYYNSLFSNVFRVYGRIVEIAINQSSFPVLMLMAIFLFRGKDLLWALVGANLVAFLLSFILYLLRMPLKLRPVLSFRLMKIIQVKGWHLFVYNTSFYMIIISTRTFISGYYSVEEFGYFTFAFALANAVQLLLNSFSFLIYPKVLNRLGVASNERIIELLSLLRKLYITTSHLLIHFAFLVAPLFFKFFSEYSPSAKIFNLIVLTVVLYSNSFGYSGLIIAKSEEKLLGILSFFTLVFNVCGVYIAIVYFNISYIYVIIVTMWSYFLYVIAITFYGRKMISLSTSFPSVLKDCFSLNMFIPYLMSFLFVVYDAPYYAYTFSFCLFVLLNFRELVSIKNFGKDLLIRPDIINV